MASEEEKRRKKEQDEKDREAAQRRRDEARERAHWTSAADEAIEQGKDDEDFFKDLAKILKKAEGMTDQEIDKAVEKARGGGWFSSKRKLTQADKDRIKRAKQSRRKKKGGWW